MRRCQCILGTQPQRTVSHTVLTGTFAKDASLTLTHSPILWKLLFNSPGLVSSLCATLCSVLNHLASLAQMETLEDAWGQVWWRTPGISSLGNQGRRPVSSKPASATQWDLPFIWNKHPNLERNKATYGAQSLRHTYFVSAVLLLTVGVEVSPKSLASIIQRVWNVWVEVPSQAPSPESCLSPDSTSEKACQMVTPPQWCSRPFKLLPLPRTNTWSSFPVSSLRCWKTTWECWYPLNLDFS